MEKELMTRYEVCEMLGIKYGTLNNYIKYGGLPYVEWDFGRKRFLRSSVIQWLKSHEKTYPVELRTEGDTTRRDAILKIGPDGRCTISVQPLDHREVSNAGTF